ncbi:hypothetical protein DL766_006655 [Monosporascus sp. MC13-8B]|uniref:DUF2406 domain-containing protein n=1 Tax=Monosporascus cannonballus TaxID=155416 RepID=A0ABY0H5M2_9PEZI|nr:hypothetical protein DL763_011245 [Monosporascus cannonballus]RYO85482.1 hypothetical protein DL762_005172 [Monosporascus cannonballus]RYP26630.1 hypothetical protein DL766_006655 [Monosporascus sp. MC13-8B]
MATANYNSHPLPAPPQQQQQGQQQYGAYYQPSPHNYQDPSAPPHNLRTKPRGFSFRSEKSQKSHKSAGSGSHHKIDIRETSAEKESNRLHSKADPTLAISEAEPSAVAQMSGDNIVKPLSAIQHRDINGNPIVDPDRSNPTRSRWERPLDTIRSFEAAIDGAYDNRKSFYRPDSGSVADWNRRSSYYGSLLTGSTPRFPQDSYYSGRRDSTMYDSRQPAMGGQQREPGYYDGYDGGRIRYSRPQPEPPTMNRPPGGRNVYPMPNNHRSYETVASGSGSGSYGEPAGYQTDPTSSENSSIERRSPPKRQDPVNDYGISFGQESAYQTPNFGIPTGAGAVDSAPPPPRHQGGSLLRKASKAGTPGSAQDRRGMGEKRKSWFSRRFSKNA